MKSVKRVFKAIKKKVTRQKRKSRYSDKSEKTKKIQARKKSKSFEVPLITLNPTSEHRKRVRTKVKKQIKCIQKICNLKFDIHTKHDKTKLKPVYAEESDPGIKCHNTNDINLKGCFEGDVEELKQTFLGEGGFARVFPVKGKPNKIMRITRGWENTRETSFQFEKNGMKLIEKLNNADPGDNMNIVRIDKYGIYKTFYQGISFYGIYALQDKYMGGDLYEIQKRYRKEIRNYPDFMYKIMVDISKAVAFIHKNNICNRDIKSENIMVVKPIQTLNDVPEIRLIDFGLSTTIEQDGLVSRKNSLNVGTTNFKSPEMIKGERYGALTDVWSLGVTFYDMYRFITPFEKGFERDSDIDTISYGSMETYDPDLYNLLRSMICLKESRISATELVTTLEAISKKKQSEGVIHSETGVAKNSYV